MDPIIDLIDAYRRTRYRVFDPAGPFVMTIGVVCPELQRCQARHGVNSSLFITAWNPGSNPRPADENHAAQQKLLQVIRRRNFRMLDGEGESPCADWIAEPSFLVLGIGESEARQLGQDAEQLAIVYAGPDAIPRLVVLRAGPCDTGKQ